MLCYTMHDCDLNILVQVMCSISDFYKQTFNFMKHDVGLLHNDKRDRMYSEN